MIQSIFETAPDDLDSSTGQTNRFFVRHTNIKPDKSVTKQNFENCHLSWKFQCGDAPFFLRGWKFHRCEDRFSSSVWTVLLWTGNLAWKFSPLGQEQSLPQLLYQGSWFVNQLSKTRSSTSSRWQRFILPPLLEQRHLLHNKRNKFSDFEELKTQFKI